MVASFMVQPSPSQQAALANHKLLNPHRVSPLAPPAARCPGSTPRLPTSQDLLHDMFSPAVLPRRTLRGSPWPFSRPEHGLRLENSSAAQGAKRAAADAAAASAAAGTTLGCGAAGAAAGTAARGKENAGAAGPAAEPMVQGPPGSPMAGLAMGKSKGRQEVEAEAPEQQAQPEFSFPAIPAPSPSPAVQAAEVAAAGRPFRRGSPMPGLLSTEILQWEQLGGAQLGGAQLGGAQAAAAAQAADLTPSPPAPAALAVAVAASDRKHGAAALEEAGGCSWEPQPAASSSSPGAEDAPPAKLRRLLTGPDHHPLTCARARLASARSPCPQLDWSPTAPQADEVSAQHTAAAAASSRHGRSLGHRQLASLSASAAAAAVAAAGSRSVRIFRMPATGGLMPRHFSSGAHANSVSGISLNSAGSSVVPQAPLRYTQPAAPPVRSRYLQMPPRFTSSYAVPATQSAPSCLAAAGQACGAGSDRPWWQEQEEVLAALAVPRRLQLVNERTARLLNQPVGGLAGMVLRGAAVPWRSGHVVDLRVLCRALGCAVLSCAELSLQGGVFLSQAGAMHGQCTCHAAMPGGTA